MDNAQTIEVFDEIRCKAIPENDLFTSDFAGFLA
jgi:hypothetical protein